MAKSHHYWIVEFGKWNICLWSFSSIYYSLRVSCTTRIFGLYFNSFYSISLKFCMGYIWMVRQLVLKFGEDWTIMSYSCPYPSMLIWCVSTCSLTWQGLEDTSPNLTWRCVGNYTKWCSNLHQILTQVTGPFMYFPYKIVERSGQNCWNTSQKCVSYTKLLIDSIYCHSERKQINNHKMDTLTLNCANTQYIIWIVYLYLS